MAAPDSSAVIADLLAHGQRVCFPARGDSMHPIIREHDTLHVAPAAPEAVRRGDVVLTLAARGLTAHRVVELGGGRLVTRGDNAPADDEALDTTAVLGKVVLVERHGRTFRVRRMQGLLLQLARFSLRVLARLAQ